MAIEPSLATAWEPIGEGEGWRFTLRQGVTFHDGAAFTAEDVRFSYERASSEASDVASWFAPVSDVVVVDDYTVDILTSTPQPIFPDSIANWMMMDSGWAAANGAELPARDAENHATLNVNGTGAFMLSERQPGLTTTLVPFDGWWGDVEHNITEAVFTPIQNSATAVAALLSGDVDLINPVPVQDAGRLDEADGVGVLRGIEARVIMLGFAHDHEVLYGGANAGEPNPFSDPLVRQAVAQAVNVEAILATIMRGSAEPASQLVSASMRGFSTANDTRPEVDLHAARALLAEAGYPDGFGFELACPNDRYLNDEAVCQAVVSMLAQIGLEVSLNAMPVANYWPELRADNYDMYLLGWSPGTFDAEHPIRFLVHTNGERLGTWNFGGYSNPRIDEMLPLIQSEIDDTGPSGDARRGRSDHPGRYGLCANVCAAAAVGHARRGRADAASGQLSDPALGHCRRLIQLNRPEGPGVGSPGLFIAPHRAAFKPQAQGRAIGKAPPIAVVFGRVAVVIDRPDAIGGHGHKIEIGGALSLATQVHVEPGGHEMLRDVVHARSVPDRVGVVLKRRPAQCWVNRHPLGGRGKRRGGIVICALKGQERALGAAGVLPDLPNAALIARHVIRRPCDKEHRDIDPGQPICVPKPALLPPGRDRDCRAQTRVGLGQVAVGACQMHGQLPLRCPPGKIDGCLRHAAARRDDRPVAAHRIADERGVVGVDQPAKRPIARPELGHRLKHKELIERPVDLFSVEPKAA